MDKQLLEKLINENKSSYEIAKEVGKSQTTVKYWLKKHGLKTNYKTHSTIKVINDHKICTYCNINKPLSDYHIKDKATKRLNNKCKLCFNNEAKERMLAAKIMFINYKGGQCISCGYNKCIAALEFHHLDPMEKDFEISNYKINTKNVKTLDANIKNELDKCVLLCANCHREIHNGLLKL